VARTIQKRYFTPLRVAKKLRKLLESPIYSHRAELTAQRLRSENGVVAACNALEELARRKRSPFREV
jgi:rhamnosyltransferase subunit B